MKVSELQIIHHYLCLVTSACPKQPHYWGSWSWDLFPCSYSLWSKIEEDHSLTITTHISQQVKFFHSLIFFHKVFQKIKRRCGTWCALICNELSFAFLMEAYIQFSFTWITRLMKSLFCRFVPILRICLNQICGYRQLIADVEAVRKVPYSSENISHERLLLQVCMCLFSFYGSRQICYENHICFALYRWKLVRKGWRSLNFPPPPPLRNMGFCIFRLGNKSWVTNPCPPPPQKKKKKKNLTL